MSGRAATAGSGRPAIRSVEAGVLTSSALPPIRTLDTIRVLGERGLRLADEQLMARYARIVGDDGRHEILIFYNEPLEASGARLADVATADSELRPGHESLGDAIQRQALAAFHVTR